MTWGEYIDFETMDAKAEARKEGLAEGLAEGRIESKREDIIEALTELETVPNSILQQINSSTDIEQLRKWHKIAISVDNISAFEEKM